MGSRRRAQEDGVESRLRQRLIQIRMAAFGRQLSDTDIAAAITYERNAFGNQTGQMIEPARIAAARQGKG